MKAVDWDYLAEGNHHIVLKYTGTTSTGSASALGAERGGAGPRGEGAVLRFAKAGTTDRHRADDAFLTTVLQPVFTSKYVHRSEVVILSSEFLRQISDKIQEQRPIGRRSKSIPSEECTGFLEVDLTVCVGGRWQTHTPADPPAASPIGAGAGTGVAMCIEIKVKCGLTPCSPVVEDDNYDIKVSNSKYAFMQLVKCAQDRAGTKTPWGEHITAASSYNPAELCSGDIESVFQSCQNLVSSPQNNFIVFMDGTPVYGLKNTDGERFRQACRSFLIPSAAEESSPSGDDEQPIDDVLRIIANMLCREDILQRLQFLQALDVVDIMGAHAILEQLASHLGNDLKQAVSLVDQCIFSREISPNLYKIIKPRLSFAEDLLHKYQSCVQVESESSVNSDLLAEAGGDMSSEDLRELEEKIVTDLFLLSVTSNTPIIERLRKKQEARMYISRLNKIECVLLLRLWLVALGASDASVMLSMLLLDHTHPTTHSSVEDTLQTDSSPGVYCLRTGAATTAVMYSLAVTDVGPKPASKILSKAKAEQGLCDMAIEQHKLQKG
jgi:hypothetical protein